MSDWDASPPHVLVIWDRDGTSGHSAIDQYVASILSTKRLSANPFLQASWCRRCPLTYLSPCVRSHSSPMIVVDYCVGQSFPLSLLSVARLLAHGQHG